MKARNNHEFRNLLWALAFSLLVISVIKPASAEPMQLKHKSLALGMITNAEKLDFITAIPSNFPLDWLADSCEQAFPIANKNKYTQACIVKNSSVYLKDTQNRVLQINDFLPIAILNLGGRSGLYFYSDSRAEHLVLGFGSNGSFKDVYLLDSEPLQDKTQKKLLYSKILMWYSYSLAGSNTCAEDFLKGLGESPINFSSLYLHTPMQIKIVNLSDKDNFSSKAEWALIQQIDATLSNVIQLVKKEPAEDNVDFPERLFVFLSTNAPNKKMFNYFLLKYKAQLNSKVIGVYKRTKSCQ